MIGVLYYTTMSSSLRKLSILFATALAAAVLSADVMPSSSTRYATDAYPGFDRESEIVKDGKKTPRWFGWINGPKCATAAEQLAYAEECEANEEWRAARRGYDALVREWPTAPEAPKAQLRLAELYLNHYAESENAFKEYLYLLEYYSVECDYDQLASKLFEVAKQMRRDGKDFLFFHFLNTVDVRRAFEAVVLRSPGAPYAAEAMFTVAELRVEEEEYEKAVEVYENLRNLHPDSPEAKKALHLEAAARMQILRDHEYNRPRCLDTIAFLRMALVTGTDSDERADYLAWKTEATKLLEDEAYRAAKYYDSRTRTRRSAINAYKRFISEYPASDHVSEAQARLAELEDEAK